MIKIVGFKVNKYSHKVQLDLNYNSSYPDLEQHLGMLTAKNIEAIIKLGQKYVMAIPRAWTKKYLKKISIDESTMRKIKDDLYAKFLPDIDGQRFLLCLNTQKREDDSRHRLQRIETIRDELEKLN